MNRASLQQPRRPVPERSHVHIHRGHYYTVDNWNALDESERKEIIAAGFEARSHCGMNDQTGDSIEWARHSLNTVTGCKTDCIYCYARDQALLHYSEGPGFEPAFWPSRLAGPARTKVNEAKAAKDPSHRNIFANSMSDLYGKWVPEEWILATLEMARRNPQWNFLTLTKFPQRAADFDFPDNVWMGTSVDAQARVANAEKAFERIRCKTKWLSVEPLLEPLRFERLDLFQWVVIGGASKSAKTPKWVPPFDWVARLTLEAHAAGLRVYHKTNLYLGDEIRLLEFPWTTTSERELPDVFRYLKAM